MNTIWQHIPGSVEGVEPEVNSFDSQHEMLNIEWVNRWSGKDNFLKYSLSGDTLMAEFEDGKVWWVIGFIRDTRGLDLPAWKKPTEMKDG